MCLLKWMKTVLIVTAWKVSKIRSFFWSVFSHIRIRMRENTDQKKLRIWAHFTQWVRNQWNFKTSQYFFLAFIWGNVSNRFSCRAIDLNLVLISKLRRFWKLKLIIASFNERFWLFALTYVSYTYNLQRCTCIVLTKNYLVW